MFMIDKPITCFGQDQLERTNFVRALVKSILTDNDQECGIITLNGSKGSGKSSLLNLIHTELTNTSKYLLSDTAPVVMRFDPWLYSGYRDLVESFFDELIDCMRNTTHLPITKWNLTTIEQYKKTILGIPTKRQKTLPTIKAEVAAIYSKQPHKVIITIDNLEHLPTGEIKEFVQLLHCFSNIPNFIYIIALDQNYITSAMQQTGEIDPKNLLDKITDISFTIPTINRQNLATMLMDNLHAILQHHDIKEWDKLDLERLYKMELHNMTQNIRDIAHYTNLVNFSYQWLGIDVNHIDLFAITAIQLFMPDIYNAIRNNKDLFTTLIDKSCSSRDELIKQEQERFAYIQSLTTKHSKQYTRQLLTQLFPKIVNLHEEQSSIENEKIEWQRTHRICNPATFDRFFTLSMSTEQIDDAEAETLLSHLNNAETFNETIKGLIVNGRAMSCLTLFNDYLPQKINEENINGAILTIFDSGDLFPENTAQFRNYDIPMQLHQIVLKLLIKIDDRKKWFTVIEHALTDCSLSLYIPIAITLRLQKDRLFSAAQTNRLSRIIVQKITRWASEKRLIEHPHLPEILLTWKNFSQTTVDHKFIIRLIATDEDLVKFIVAFLRPAALNFIANITRKETWKLDLEKIAKFVSLDRIEPRIGAIFADSGRFRRLREQEQTAILIFLDSRQPDWSILCSHKENSA